ncbi:MAG: 4-hydroxy-tetrahydrodipicolinate synthase [Acutalibacteraceae bacterium]
MKKLKGIIPAMLTPVTADFMINEHALRQLTNRLIDAGANAIFALGTNGEFFSLCKEDRLKVTKTVIDEVAGRVPVVIGTGAASTREAVELSKAAEALGADYLSVITPYFNALSQREVKEYYTQIANAVNIPILLYNIPGRTGINLEAETVRELSAIPNIVGIKDSSGKFENILKYIEYTKDIDFSVYAGTDSLILKTLMAGGDGAVAATANVLPEIVISIYKHWQNGEIEMAEKAQESLSVIRDFSAGFSIPSTYKAAVELQGIEAGPPVPPALPLNEADKARLKAVLDEYKSLY